MPEILDLYQNDGVFPAVGWTSQWLNCSSSFQVLFNTFESSDCEIGVRWAVDNNFEVIDEEIFPVTGGISESITREVKTRFVQFFVQNIAVQPSILRSNGFFFTDECR
jgi:hypothetical protein